MSPYSTTRPTVLGADGIEYVVDYALPPQPLGEIIKALGAVSFARDPRFTLPPGIMREGHFCAPQNASNGRGGNARDRRRWRRLRASAAHIP